MLPQAGILCPCCPTCVPAAWARCGVWGRTGAPGWVGSARQWSCASVGALASVPGRSGAAGLYSPVSRGPPVGRPLSGTGHWEPRVADQTQVQEQCGPSGTLVEITNCPCCVVCPCIWGTGTCRLGRWPQPGFLFPFLGSCSSFTGRWCKCCSRPCVHDGSEVVST